MPLLDELERGCKTGRSAADDSDLLSGGRSHGDRMRIAVLAHLVCGEILEMRNGNRRLYVLAAAGRLARMGTDPSNRRRKREHLHDCGYRVGEASLGNLLHVLLAVRVRRAVELARAYAVSVVVAHEKIERQFARLQRTFARGAHDHALCSLRRAGAEKLRTLLHLDNAHSACAIGLEFLPEAEIGDLNAGLCGGCKDGRPLLDRNLNTVNRQIHCCHDHRPFSQR